MRGCQQSVLVDDCQAHAGVAFTDSVLEGQFATEYTNGGPVKVQNSVIRANAYKDIVMDLHGSGTVIVTGCTIDTAGGKNAAAWAVKINTDRSAFTGNTFTGKYTKHIYVDQSSLGAVLTGNAVTSGKLTVEDVSSGDCFY